MLAFHGKNTAASKKERFPFLGLACRSDKQRREGCEWCGHRHGLSDHTIALKFHQAKLHIEEILEKVVNPNGGSNPFTPIESEKNRICPQPKTSRQILGFHPALNDETIGDSLGWAHTHERAVFVFKVWVGSGWCFTIFHRHFTTNFGGFLPPDYKDRVSSNHFPISPVSPPITHTLME